MPGPTTSIWHQTFTIPPRPALTRDVTTDVCVVGAGIAGLSVAYALARAGKRVIVVDLDGIGSGESGHTTAHLTNEIDDRYTALEKARGNEDARHAAESHTAAINRIEETIRIVGIDCDFTRLDGYLFCAPGDSVEILDKELEATKRVGLSDTTRVERAPIRDFDTGVALRFPMQGRFHILKYLAGLAEGIERAGGTIHGKTKVESIEGGTPAKVKTATGHTITATDVAVCTNGAISDLVVTHAKQAPYRTLVVALRVPKGSVEDALYWDTGDPYHYVRIQPMDDSSDALIVGGEDFKTAHADDAGVRFQRLEQWTRERWPMAGERITQWTGQVLEPNDYLAYIGANPDRAPHVWLATGDSGMGMTHGTIAGILLEALIMGKDHPWAKLYDPRRITLHPREMAELAKENVDVAVQYADYVTPGEVDDVATIKPGEGRVIRRGIHKVAAYRDDEGVLHERSAVCTHVKCIVGWNTAEKSWDCPCHGSRFDAYGKVVNGPAIEDLGEAPEG
jgi:glycine/D-amino acid oxidase-like deaminating enzyme/nitrite reductase/ring-hydroxylating ferredoxin subunit